MTKFIMCALILLGCIPAFSQESQTQSKIEMPAPKSNFERLNFYIDALPIPILGGGLGAGIEMETSKQISLFLGIKRETFSNYSGVPGIEKSEEVTWDKRMGGIRLYLRDFNRHGLFITIGYLGMAVQARFSPGLFSGVEADETTIQNGTFGGLGYRVLGASRWKIDVALNYEPAKKARINYIGDELGLFGPTKAHLETEYSYGPALDARIAYRF